MTTNLNNPTTETKALSKASKKEDLWEAYTELLAQLEEKENQEPQKKQVMVQQKEMVQKASENNPDKINKSIADLKNVFSETLEKLQDGLITESRKLESLRKAIEIEQKSLEEMYDIKANAHALTALILLQKEKKNAYETEMEEIRNSFEKEMKDKKLQWQKEQEETEKTIKEQKAEAEKQKKREEDEYNYNIALTRKKDADAYAEKATMLDKQLAEKKAMFEKAIAERETAISNAETELADLRKRVSAHPKELEVAVANAEKTLTAKLTAQFDFEKQLNQKQLEGEQKLNDQTIQTLKEKIKDLEAIVKELTVKTATAELSVKDIAMKAIESGGKLKLIESSRKVDNE